MLNVLFNYFRRGRKNWRSKNYQELRFPGCKIAVLDENWMIFLSTNRYARFNDEAVQRTTSFFNCHTQRKHDGITATNITVHPNVILSSTQYGAERDPVYFGETPIRNKYQIVRNRQVIDCKAIEALMRGRSPYHSVNYYAMDQRMFISERKTHSLTHDWLTVSRLCNIRCRLRQDCWHIARCHEFSPQKSNQHVLATVTSDLHGERF